MGLVVFLLMCACFLAFNLLRYFNIVGFPSRHVLMPYQSGLLYRRGRPVRQVDAGRHTVFVGTEKILFLDTRPIQFNIEDRAVLLADGATAIYSFSASAKISDITKAMSASTTYSQLPVFTAICITRDFIGRHSSNHLARGRASLEEELIDVYKSRLALVGFELLSYRLSQLSIAPFSTVDG